MLVLSIGHHDQVCRNAEQDADMPGRIGRVTDEMQALWDREAVTFDDAPDHGLRDPAVRRAWTDLLLPLLGGHGRRVADLGCGTGTLSALLATEGRHLVHGVDLSPEMVRRARAKSVQVLPQPIFTVADAADPPLPTAMFDAVLSRHVLWAMPDPSAALRRWIELLAPGGVLILVEGRWSTGAGLTAAECSRLVGDLRDVVDLRPLDDPAYWGRLIDDERYLIVSAR
ncbi:class I SAM-dependent methyltransferase [Agrococcus versicolor]|uniref:Class I SAM-dependent methyltransferase n=1 Tax=Agrococcus versicolor TaxID=501482 RepID=A0ABP5MLL6_9MICO